MIAPESKPLVVVGRPPDPVDTATDVADEADDATSTVPATAVGAPVLMRVPARPDRGFATINRARPAEGASTMAALRVRARECAVSEAGRAAPKDGPRFEPAYRTLLTYHTVVKKSSPDEGDKDARAIFEPEARRRGLALAKLPTALRHEGERSTSPIVEIMHSTSME